MDGSTTVQFLDEGIRGRARLRWMDGVEVVRAEVREGFGEEIDESYDDQDYSEEVRGESLE